jgi:hypothetical protein
LTAFRAPARVGWMTVDPGQYFGSHDPRGAYLLDIATACL